MTRRFILVISSLLFHLVVSSQSIFDIWARNVNWDGVSHWSRYMISMPAYQGPNSLPVPRIGNGSADSIFSVSATANAHFSKGDNTQNLALYINYPLVKNVITIDGWWVPYERYQTSDAVKEKRHLFFENYYEKEATGELIINTTIQLFNKLRSRHDFALRMGYRIPCGSAFGVARYTDGPGYYFDLSYGKPLGKSGLKWISMLGFYTWQIVSDRHRQDDAFLFGTGAEWNNRSFKLQAGVAGYIGYMENSGDKPVVARLNMEKNWKRVGLLLNLQRGLHDFAYTSIETGLKYRLEK
jgi:hypothetical protein